MYVQYGAVATARHCTMVQYMYCAVLYSTPPFPYPLPRSVPTRPRPETLAPPPASHLLSVRSNSTPPHPPSLPPFPRLVVNVPTACRRFITLYATSTVTQLYDYMLLYCTILYSTHTNHTLVLCRFLMHCASIPYTTVRYTTVHHCATSAMEQPTSFPRFL